MSHTALTPVAFMYFDMSLWTMNSIVPVPACVFHTWDRRPCSLYIEFVHTGSSIFTPSLYSNFSYSITVDVVCRWFHYICISFGGLWNHGTMILCEVLLFISVPYLKKVNFECGHMVELLGSLSGVILVYSGSLHYGASFWYFSLLGYREVMLLM